VHGDGVAEPDVLAQVLVVEDDACAVGEPFGGKAIRRLVDCGDAPAVAVVALLAYTGLSLASWSAFASRTSTSLRGGCACGVPSRRSAAS
jgi:hypothetical protein